MAYNVVMFAYNEAKNIETSMRSVFDASGEQLDTFYILCNGCTDDTAQRAERTRDQLGFTQCRIEQLTIGDKCNTWNHYWHALSGDQVVHFMVDADVKFSAQVFENLHRFSTSLPASAHVIAGLPLSGRNKDYYRSLVEQRHCFFGNLYGVTKAFRDLIIERQFRLPMGLNWIDSFITKGANTDLTFDRYDRPERVFYQPGEGYYFDSLSPFKRDDIKLYLNRIARYQLGKWQEIELDKIAVSQWPTDMHDINQRLSSQAEKRALSIHHWLAKRRLKRLLRRAQS